MRPVTLADKYTLDCGRVYLTGMQALTLLLLLQRWRDLAANARWGTQQIGLSPGAKYDGVFGIWYGKGLGVERCGDVFKHANGAGSALDIEPAVPPAPTFANIEKPFNILVTGVGGTGVVTLAPPLLARPDPMTGRIAKHRHGPWMMSAFRWLARARKLRERARAKLAN